MHLHRPRQSPFRPRVAVLALAAALGCVCCGSLDPEPAGPDSRVPAVGWVVNPVNEGLGPEQVQAANTLRAAGMAPGTFVFLTVLTDHDSDDAANKDTIDADEAPPARPVPPDANAMTRRLALDRTRSQVAQWVLRKVAALDAEAARSGPPGQENVPGGPGSPWSEPYDVVQAVHDSAASLQAANTSTPAGLSSRHLIFMADLSLLTLPSRALPALPSGTDVVLANFSSSHSDSNAWCELFRRAGAGSCETLNPAFTDIGLQHLMQSWMGREAASRPV